MKHVWQALSPNLTQAQALLRWALGLFVLPLCLFVVAAVLQAPGPADVVRVQTVDLWAEPLGRVTFDGAYLPELVQKAPDFTQAQWNNVALPNSIEMGPSIDLPPDAPKARAWFRVKVPAQLAQSARTHGRLGLMGNRVQGGPWAVWVDGKLLQANLADWRMQWNTPLRVMLPLDTTEFMIAVPYAQIQGYAMGSLFVGPADAIDIAWQKRNFWQAEAPTAASIVVLLTALMTLPLALRRRKEPVYFLLCVNGFIWAVSNFQYLYDFTGQDQLSVWFGVAVDLSTSWCMVISSIFALEFEKIEAPRWRVFMLLYACILTLLTLPVWQWEKNALVGQHLITVAIYSITILILGWHVVRAPRREGIVLLVALGLQIPLGIHSLLYVSNQSQPDHIHTYPFGGLLEFGVFMYVISRRTVSALNTAEHHEGELRSQLAEQERRMAAQHTLLQREEVSRQLVVQHDAIMLDLHDNMGCNLNAALLQARGGTLTPQETVLMLQDLTDELRHWSKLTAREARSPNAILAELRQRYQHRLNHAGIKLIWAVDPALPAIEPNDPASGQHLRALLSEALSNIIKHAQATQIRVTACVDGDVVVIELVDNGKGFTPGAVETGRGLPGMQRRAHILGAQLQIDSTPTRGSCWKLSLPVC